MSLQHDNHLLLLHLPHLSTQVVDILHLTLASLERVVLEEKLFELM